MTYIEYNQYAFYISQYGAVKYTVESREHKDSEILVASP